MCAGAVLRPPDQGASLILSDDHSVIANKKLGSGFFNFRLEYALTDGECGEDGIVFWARKLPKPVSQSEMAALLKLTDRDRIQKLSGGELAAARCFAVSKSTWCPLGFASAIRHD